MTTPNITNGHYGGSLTLAAEPRLTSACSVSAASVNAPRIFAAAEWRRLANARRRHKTLRRTNSVPTPYQRRVQRARHTHEKYLCAKYSNSIY